MLQQLEGSLDVARLNAVYEDSTHVHVVMEYCTGGELWHAIGKSHYSERTVRTSTQQCALVVLCKAVTTAVFIFVTYGAMAR